MRRLPLLLFVLTATSAAAQHDHHAPAASPYADETGRAVKALSAEETEGLLQGRGLGYARAAELNGYPGPLHVLDLADDLALTDAQRAATEAVYAAMQAEAQALGADVVRMETHLDRLFAEGEASAAEVDRIAHHLGTTTGRLRAVHLRAHLAMLEILDPEQVAAYQRLRGYSSE